MNPVRNKMHPVSTTGFGESFSPIAELENSLFQFSELIVNRQ